MDCKIEAQLTILKTVETLFLMPLLEQVSKKQSLSSQLANKFDRKWKNNFSTFYDDFNFHHGLRN